MIRYRSTRRGSKYGQAKARLLFFSFQRTGAIIYRNIYTAGIVAIIYRNIFTAGIVAIIYRNIYTAVCWE
jgi:hypothetical protein